MKIGRRGLFGFGAAAAVAAPVAALASAKPAAGYGASPLMEAAGDFAEMTRLHRAHLLAAERAANPAWIVEQINAGDSFTIERDGRVWRVSGVFGAKE